MCSVRILVFDDLISLCNIYIITPVDKPAQKADITQKQSYAGRGASLRMSGRSGRAGQTDQPAPVSARGFDSQHSQELPKVMRKNSRVSTFINPPFYIAE